MKAVYALYPKPQSAQRAVDSIALGRDYALGDITILSRNRSKNTSSLNTIDTPG